MLKYDDFEYELIDSGVGKRIEKFGKYMITRPCPQAAWNFSAPLTPSHATFRRDNRQKTWIKQKELAEHFQIKIGHVKAQLRFSENGQVGIFPEQFENWKWIQNVINKAPDRPWKIMNGFAYTGMSTLFSSASNTEVCHVDGAKSMVNWAKKNAEISGMADSKIRWICDDIMSFMAREIRRKKRYDGIILDPPAYGRGAKSDWKIERDLPKMMQYVNDLLSPDPLFVILTCHAPEHYSAEKMAEMLENIPQFKGRKAEKIFLTIPSKNGTELLTSFGARIKSK